MAKSSEKGGTGDGSSSSSSGGEGKPPPKLYKFIPKDVYQKQRLEGKSGKDSKAKQKSGSTKLGKRKSKFLLKGWSGYKTAGAASTSASSATSGSPSPAGFQVKTQTAATLQSIPITVKTIEIEYHPMMPPSQQADIRNKTFDKLNLK